MRILLLTHRLPYAPNRGDRIRAFHLLKDMTRYATVDLVSLVHDAEEAAQAGNLTGLAASVTVAPVPHLRNRLAALPALLGSRPLTHSLLDSPAMPSLLARLTARTSPDLVFAYGSGMARFAFEKPLAALPCVVDLIDVDSAKWEALAPSVPLFLSMVYRREARALGRFELELLQKARWTFVVSERERGLLPADARVRVLELGVDRDAYVPPDEKPRTGVVVSGVFDYRPNADGALWLAQHVWPRVRTALPDATLTLAGSRPLRALRAAAARDRSITVTGSVPDIRPYLWGAAVGAAPMAISRGVQNKVLEGVAAGLPFVVTGAVAGGLPSAVLPAVTIADGPERFADALVSLLRRPPAERQDVMSSLRLDSIDWSATLAPLEAILRSVANQG